MFFLLNLAKITHLITRRFLCYPIFSKKGFLLKLLLVAFFFAFFFGGCLAKVFLCQRVKKNYCSFNTKLKCFCILVFSFFETCYPYFFLFWNVLSRSFSSCFFFFLFFLSLKQTGKQCGELEQKKGKTERQQAQFQQKTFFRKLRITQKTLFSFLERVICTFFFFGT